MGEFKWFWSGVCEWILVDLWLLICDNFWFLSLFLSHFDNLLALLQRF